MHGWVIFLCKLLPDLLVGLSRVEGVGRACREVSHYYEQGFLVGCVQVRPCWDVGVFVWYSGEAVFRHSVPLVFRV